MPRLDVFLELVEERRLQLREPVAQGSVSRRLFGYNCNPIGIVCDDDAHKEGLDCVERKVLADLGVEIIREKGM